MMDVNVQFISGLCLLLVGSCHLVGGSSCSLAGTIQFSPDTDQLKAGAGLTVDVAVNITAQDSLTDVAVALQCTNSQPNSTSDLWASYSATHYTGPTGTPDAPTSTLTSSNSLSASHSLLNLALGDALELLWQPQWIIPPSSRPALVISCVVIANFTNSSSDAITETFYGDADFTVGPYIDLENADGSPHNGSSDVIVGIGEEFVLYVIAQVPEGDMRPEVKVGPEEGSNETIAATKTSLFNASSRIVCGEFTGLDCRVRTDGDIRTKQLSFFDDEVTAAGDHQIDDDLVVRSVLRVGDDGVSDGDTALMSVSMTTGRSHMWVLGTSFNISDDGSPRATDLEIQGGVLSQALYTGDEASVSVQVQHTGISRATARDVQLHMITGPELLFSSVQDDGAILTEPPIITDTFTIFQIGNVSLFSSEGLVVNVTVQGNGTTTSDVSQSVCFLQAVYQNDTSSQALAGSAPGDFQIQYQDSSVVCEVGWSAFGSSCYLVNGTHRVNAADAAQSCADIRGAIVSIDSVFEQRFLVEILPTEMLPYRFWVSDNSTYLDWFPGQPDGSGACPSLVVAGSHWLDSDDVIGDSGVEATDCSLTRLFICEQPIIEEAPPQENITRPGFFGIPSASETFTDSHTCTCPYPPFDLKCACCKAGATVCTGAGHKVCARSAGECPVQEFYDRSVLLDGTGLRVACDNIATSSTFPRCMFSNSTLEEWQAFPSHIGDVVAYDNQTNLLYAIARDSTTYLQGQSAGLLPSDWSPIPVDGWISALSDVGLTFHQLVTSPGYTNGDMVTWNCCG